MPDTRDIPPTPSYAVLGTGAVGGYYGACLQRLGREVHFLCHRDCGHVQQHGLRIDSVNGGFTLPKVHAYNDVKQMPRCDIVIVALKTTHNHLLPSLLPPVVKDSGTVLVLQNGLGIERDIADIVGHDCVIAGLCFICSHKLGPGHIHHLDYGRVEFAQYTNNNTPAGITPPMRTIGDDFQQAGNPVLLSEDLALARWKKLIWNVPFNGLSVIHNKDTAQLLTNPDTHAQARALMIEVQAAALAVDSRVIEDAFIQKMLDDTAKMTPYHPSMKLDHDAGRPMEIEAIFSAPLRAAEAAGCATPQLQAVCLQLRQLQHRPD